MKNRFTIGQMAKLHNTPIKTLRYYDEIGLFKPIEVDKNNGYRYYSTDQFEQLNTINYLKALGISLKEIGTLLEVRNTNYFLEQLKQQRKITENKIKELKSIEKIINNRIKEIDRARKINRVEEVTIQTVQERKILKLEEKIYSEHELEISLRKLENKLNSGCSIFIGKVGLTLSLENINKNKFQEYNSIFILKEEKTFDNELVKTFPQGQYACIYYRGNHNQSPRYYKIILEYLKKERYEIIGDAIERTIINEYISKDKKDYLTEIQIPVKKMI